MGLDTQWALMSTEFVTVDPLSTVTAYGAPTYSTAATSSYRAYEETGTRLVVTGEGLQEIATSTVYVLSSSAFVAPQDRITLVDGRQPRILRVDVVRDDEGQHHLELAVQ